MAELLLIPYSPWSEKASWALELRGVPHERRVYQPLIGEPELRLLLKRWRGPVSVPLFHDGGTVVSDSYDIARYADEHGRRGARLFPEGREDQIRRYNELSERALRAGRALALTRMLSDEEALYEQVPRAMRKRLGKLALPVARLGIERTLRKYGADKASLAEHERTLREALDMLRADLAKAKGEPKTLLGELTYADIAMAQVLAYLEPPKVGMKIGPASARSFTHAGLKDAYRDLLDWRDALYARYRQPT